MAATRRLHLLLSNSAVYLRRVPLLAFFAVAPGCSLMAQQQPQPESMGAVATRDAHLNGGLEVQGEVARLLNNVSLTAYSHDAPVALNRGGHLLVCSTSEFHLLRSGTAGALIFGLDRGAVEIFSDTRPQDAVLTPDLKFVPVTKGSMDLKVRVTREGDTCVDNAGSQAPVLNVTDPFSSASYRILPGQHLLFVKGDLRKVVDHERSPCGCPPASTQTASARPGQPLTPAQAAAASHPFPQAQSEGLAPTADAANAAPAGTAGSQVTTTFSYGGENPPTVSSTGVPPAVPGTATAPPAGGFLQSIGRFFHHLFHPSSKRSPSAAPSASPRP